MKVQTLLAFSFCIGVLSWTISAQAPSTTSGTTITFEPVSIVHLYDNSTVLICNNTHLCSTRNYPCDDGPVTEHAACYCDPLCSSFGDCCIDYGDTCRNSFYSESTTIEPSAQPMITDFDDGPKLQVDKYTCSSFSYVQPERKTGFWVISKCRADVYIDIKCEDKLSFPMDIRGNSYFKKLYVPVTSAHTGLPYKNLYCALCNGEYGELHYWRLKATGGVNNTKIPDDRLLENKLFLYISSYDSITWYPPLSLETKVVRPCVELGESRCLSGESIRTNGIQGCADVTAIFRFGQNEFRKALCSRCTDKSRNFECTDRFPISFAKSEEVIGRGATLGDSNILPISVLIDFTDSAKYYVDPSETFMLSVHCAFDEVYISQTQTCTKLSCSPGSVLKENACVPAVTLDTYCPQNVHEWSFEIISGDETSCDGKINEIFNRLYLANIFVTMEDIRELSFDGGLCRYSVYVDTLMVVDASVLYEALSPFIAQVSSIRENNVDVEFAILNPIFYTSCKSALEEGCIGRLYPFQMNESHLILLHEKPYHFINDTQKLYPEEMTITQITYNADKSMVSTLLVCDGTPLTCPYVTLNKSLFMNVDSTPGFIEYKPTGRIISPDMYLLASSDLIQVCSFFDNEGSHNATSTVTLVTFSLNQTIVSTTCCCISLISLLLTFLTYARFSILHRCLSNKLIMCLCVSIFMGQLMLLLMGQANRNFTLCTAVAALTHYIWLVAFAFTFSLAYDLHRTFGSNSVSRCSEDDAKILLLYFSNSLGTPLLIVLSCLVIQFKHNQPVIYARDGICWLSGYMPMFVSFGIPIAVTLSLNCVLFVNTVLAIFRAKRLSRKILWHDLRKPFYAENLKELFIYFKISTLMGFTWITGFIANYVKTDVMWYVFVILNALQGAFIFFAFMCNRRVWRLWTQGRSSKSTTTSFKKSSEMDGNIAAMAKNKIEYNANGHDMKTIDRMVERVTRM